MYLASVIIVLHINRRVLSYSLSVKHPIGKK